jgi:hypothetical protein
MLHHVSFSARSPQSAAEAMAELLCAVAVRAPSPPFPGGSWFVVCGDACGGMIELTPWGYVVDPVAGLAHDPEMRPRSASHVLAGSALPAGELMARARRRGLAARVVDTGLFGFVKIWVEEGLLLEVLPPEQLPRYVACFGESGVADLDSRLRSLEAAIRTAAVSGS